MAATLYDTEAIPVAVAPKEAEPSRLSRSLSKLTEITTRIRDTHRGATWTKTNESE